MEYEESFDLIEEGSLVPFVQTGMIVHSGDCRDCEREGRPLWCSYIVADMYDSEFGMIAVLTLQTGERLVEFCQEIRRRYRLAQDFDPNRVYTGRWRSPVRGEGKARAEVEEDA